ncbi:MAG: hypothetical protein ABI619_14185 [Betaproteobacteria bacterium]
MIKKTAGNWAEWPECPQCQARREARCSVCSARGTDFRLADFDEPEHPEEAAGDAEVLLLCTTCDEPFTPEFYRCCAQCGHDFGAGIEEPEIVREEVNHRVVLVAVGMLLLVGGLLAFFAIALRG